MNEKDLFNLFLAIINNEAYNTTLKKTTDNYAMDYCRQNFERGDQRSL